MRLRRGPLDLSDNGAPSEIGAICTSGERPFEDGTAETVSGDVFYVVLEFSDPVRGEARTGYGNWHVPDRSTSTTD